MRKILNLFFGLLLTSIVSFAQEATTFIPDGAATPERLAKLQALMEAQIQKNGIDVTVEALGQAVKADILKAFPALTNGGKESIGEDVTLAVAAEKLDAAAHEKYPEYNQEQL
ncbi:MAG: hypothetical protein MJ106_06820, partial [Lentisphaeria bacterium]|nr:hypothetical protein [Lentisphaeria bacterium]